MKVIPEYHSEGSACLAGEMHRLPGQECGRRTIYVPFTSHLRMPYNGSDYTIRDDRDRYHVLTKRRILVLKLTLLVVEI